MKLALSLSLFLFALFTFDDKSYSLSNYQITQICKKNLKEKRSTLQRGNPIEIPVLPYKR